MLLSVSMCVRENVLFQVCGWPCSPQPEGQTELRVPVLERPRHERLQELWGVHNYVCALVYLCERMYLRLRGKLSCERLYGNGRGIERLQELWRLQLIHQRGIACANE